MDREGFLESEAEGNGCNVPSEEAQVLGSGAGGARAMPRQASQSPALGFPHTFMHPSGAQVGQKAQVDSEPSHP